MTARAPDRGGQLEELLRDYFIESGFFAVRGVPMIVDGIEVTDIDLWLYSRSSLTARERCNVDCKYRDRPKAIERIVWAKGMQVMLGLERCVVATTDARTSIGEFAARRGVLVIDGRFLSQLRERADEFGNSHHLTEEGFLDALAGIPKERGLGNWRQRLRIARGRLLDSLSYAGCNAWLEDVRVFAEGYAAMRQPALLRMIYVNMSFFLVGLDFVIGRDFLIDATQRRNAIERGVRFGDADPEPQLRFTADIMNAFAPELRHRVQEISASVRAGLNSAPAQLLAEYFARPDVSTDLFKLARSFERAAYAIDVELPSQLQGAEQAVIGVVLDYLGLARVPIMSR